MINVKNVRIKTQTVSSIIYSIDIVAIHEP